MTSNKAFNDLVAGGDPDLLAENFRFIEGPVWLPSGQLLFSDIPADRIYAWNGSSSCTVFRSPSHQANGLTLDLDGCLLACEHQSRRVTRTLPDGSIVTVADSYSGQRLNSPNDIVVRSDGAVFFTDPPYGVAAEERELEFQGVYRLSPDGTLALLVSDFEMPNGLAFSPDESLLYIDDSQRHHIRVFAVSPAGELSSGRVFAEFQKFGHGNADGLKVDTLGNVFCTGPGGVHVFDPKGALLGHIPTPEVASNCAFGGTDWCDLFITCSNALRRIRVKHPGLPVPVSRR